MKELKGICPWCLGCNRLENPEFEGFYRCEGFMPHQINWEEYYRESLMKENKK